MNKIVFLIPYFGKLPKYFSGWFASTANLRSIDFILLTDADTSDIPPISNLTIRKLTWHHVQSLIIEKMKAIGFDKLCIDYPYKLCEYKPAYGYIFDEYLKGYEYWGFCDIDLIWGNLEEFLRPILNQGYDKIFQFGHCMLFKNTPEINMLFKSEIIKPGFNFKTAIDSSRVNHFDEIGLNLIFKKSGKKMYWEDHSVTPSFFSCEMRPGNPKYKSTRGIFMYIPQLSPEGEYTNHTFYVYEDGDKVVKEECSYLHFLSYKYLNFLAVDFTRPIVISHRGAYNVDTNDDIHELINRYGISTKAEQRQKKYKSLVSKIRTRTKNLVQEIKYRGLSNTIKEYVQIIKFSKKYGANIDDLYRDEFGDEYKK